jgi:hypothetical protein
MPSRYIRDFYVHQYEWEKNLSMRLRHEQFSTWTQWIGSTFVCCRCAMCCRWLGRRVEWLSWIRSMRWFQWWCCCFEERVDKIVLIYQWRRISATRQLFHTFVRCWLGIVWTTAIDQLRWRWLTRFVRRRRTFQRNAVRTQEFGR